MVSSIAVYEYGPGTFGSGTGAPPLLDDEVVPELVAPELLVVEPELLAVEAELLDDAPPVPLELAEVGVPPPPLELAVALDSLPLPPEAAELIAPLLPHPAPRGRREGDALRCGALSVEGRGKAAAKGRLCLRCSADEARGPHAARCSAQFFFL